MEPHLPPELPLEKPSLPNPLSVAPALRSGDRGAAVVTLLGALLRLIDRGDLLLTRPSEQLVGVRGDLSTQHYGSSTAELVRQFRVQNGITDGDTVDEATAARLTELANSIVLRGVVYVPPVDGPQGSSGTLSSGVTVRAYDYDVGSGRQIGEATTDDAGQYRITVPAEVVSTKPAVYVSVVDDERIVEQSPVVFHPEQVTTINIGIHPERASRPPEFERLNQVLEPRLEGRELRELTQDQAAVLGADQRTSADQVTAGIETSRVMHRVRDLAARAGVGLEDLDQPLTETVYALVREVPGMDLEGVLGWSNAAVFATVQQAVEHGRIAPEIGDEVDKVATLLRSLRVAQRLEPAAAGAPASLGDLLRTLPKHEQLGAEDRLAVSTMMDGDDAPVSGWDQAKYEPVARTLMLGQITAGHAPLVDVMQAGDSGAGTSLRDVAALDRGDWARLVERHGIPAHLGLPADQPALYVDHVLRNVERQMPSLYVAARVADGRMPLDSESASAGVVRFLANATTFRFGDQPVLGRFAETHEHDFDGIEEDALPDAQRALLTMERVARVSGTLESAQHLLARGYESARQVALVHRGRFVEEVGDVLPGGAAAAEEIHDRATAATAAAAGLLLGHAPAFNRTPTLPVMPGSEPGEVAVQRSEMHGVQAALRSAGQTATIEALFGNQDDCGCSTCSSMYSPAAYVVELLQMLDGGSTNGGGLSALDVLLRRRPDLAELELNCDNTRVEVPYLDLVLELMESALAEGAFWNAFARGQRDAAGDIDDWGFDPDLDSGRLPIQLKDDLARVGIDLGDSPRVAMLPSAPDKRWRVTGSGWRLHLRGSNPARLRITIYPQSKAGAAVDEAVPRDYVSWAYEPLEVARFPWAFPFDLDHVETDAWLGRLKTSRREVLDAYAGSPRWSRLDAACAVLGIYEGERRRLMEPATDSWLDWGYATEMVPTEDRSMRQWHMSLRVVSEFRHRARLSHPELLQLLDTSFFQSAPGFSNPIILTGDECNSDLMRVGDWPESGPLNPATLRRAFLFLRLARRLRWDLRDLDAAIRAHGHALDPVTVPVPQATSTTERFTESFIVYVANIVRLRELTRLPVEAIINIFRGKLDPVRYWDYAGNEPVARGSYAERFLRDPVASRPRATGLELTPTRDELVSPTPVAADAPRIRHVDYVGELAAALSCRVSDVIAVLAPAITSIPITNLGAGANQVDGAWVDVAAADGVHIEWVVGYPSDAATRVRIVVQELDQTGTPVSVGTPVEVSRGSNDWRQVVRAYAGTSNRIRVRAERVAGTGTMWVTARVLTGPGLVDERLTLASLTRLCGHVRLARGAKLPPRDYVALVRMSGVDPLTDPQSALSFLESARVARSAGLTVPELDVLLRHRYATAVDEADAARVVGQFLTSFRERMQASEATLRGTPENAPDLTRQLLLEIGWPERLVDRLLGGDALAREFPSRFQAPMEPLSDDVVSVLPAGLSFSASTLAWSAPPGAAATTLASAVGTLTGSQEYLDLPNAEQLRLDAALAVLAAQATTTQQDVANANAPLVDLARSLQLPTHQAEYPSGAVPSGEQVEIPKEWRGAFWFDPGTSTFRFLGTMTQGWRDTIAGFGGTPSGSPFRRVVDELFVSARTYAEAAPNRLVTRLSTPPTPGALTSERVLGELTSLSARCLELLEHIVPVAREVRATSIARQLMAETFDLTPDRAIVLVDRFRHTSAGRTLPLVARQPDEGWLVMSSYAGSDPAVAVDASSFPAQMSALSRVGKLALVVAGCALTEAETAWLFGGWDAVGNRFDLSSLPLQRVTGASPLWTTWLDLATLLDVPQASDLDREDLEVLRAAASRQGDDGAAYRVVAGLVGIPADNVARLATLLGLGTTAGLLDPARLVGFARSAALMRRTGADATTFDLWRAAPSRSGAAWARQLARAAIGDFGWRAASAPVFDRLRMQRRDALIEYWVQRRGLRDANDLYGSLLVDPEMGACAVTTRIRQAISTVQVFIHRVVMGLEPDVRTDAIDPERWAWMKNYRVWEANRKVLLYPENWIEPDLRLDRTAPFVALTGELSEGDVTDDAAELAMRAYVDGLADIARVEAVGMCCEYDGTRLSIVHVFGRTRHEPFAYFYRQFHRRQPGTALDHEGDWTPWEPLPVEVEGNHLVPFFWQGRMFLFWPVFGERAVPPAPDGSAQANQQPTKRLTMKIAWSELRNGAWTPRKLLGADAFGSLGLSAGEWLANDVYLRPSPQERAVAIDVYLSGIGIHSDPIQTEVDLAKTPVVTLSFDGDELRLAAGIIRYWDAWPPPGRVGFYYQSVQANENPITADLSTSIGLHRGMTLYPSTGSLVLPSQGSSLTVLTQTPREKRLLLPAEEPVLAFRAPSAVLVGLGEKPLPFFYVDNQRQFFVYPTNKLGTRVVQGPSGFPLIILEDVPQLHVTAVDHPHIGRFRKTLHHQGLDRLLAPETQTEPAPPDGIRGAFATAYHPDPALVATQPDDDVVFSPTQPAGPYNWELFFHAPVAIGSGLSRNHQFAQAREWFHHVFNPTDTSSDPGPARYWRFRPFRELGSGPAIAELVRRLADPNDVSPEKQAFLHTIAQWRENPFEPHLVARLRPRAYMYSTVMKYLDNLVAWADQLFRRDSRESIDEATQIYVLAAQILGRRPEVIMHRTRPVPMAFAELRPELGAGAGAVGNPLVIAENIIGAGGGATRNSGPLPLSLYFCVPDNPKLREYYATVDDRLGKIRSCLNIDGVARPLALFDPPIDPGMLVRARAAGVDISAILADANAPLPLYRFSVMSQKAVELADDVRELGAALLSAMEKRDAEALARLRSGHELSALANMRLVKQLQVQEARANLESLGPALENAQARLAFYVGLLSQVEEVAIPNGPAGPTVASIAAAAVDTIATTLEISQAIISRIDPVASASTELLKQALSRASQALGATLPDTDGAKTKVPMNNAEKRHLEELGAARDAQVKGFDQKAAARFFAMLPDFTFGSSGAYGSPVVTAQLGGSLLSKAAELFALQSDGAAAEHGHRANLASILAAYQRRAAEWMHQATTASRDIDQLVKQVAASTVRISIANLELGNHDLDVSNAEEADAFMREKVTNQELFGWMLQRTADVHFRSYQLAYDVAKRAEQAYRHELGLETSQFIQFGYWDSLRRGLGAGERLLHDIKRMEVSYLNDNRRELEIVKHVSLRQLDGAALLRLRSEGECEFEVPEALFDIDFAGHYFRRVKNVSVSVPCVVGPYTGVNGTLTLLSSSVRTRSRVVDAYDAPENYTTSRVPIQQIATSSGQADSGLFELSFGDVRFLPFEGAGCLSRWRFSLPKAFRAFDYATITDVVLHLRYTARDGGQLLAGLAEQSLVDRLNTLTHAGSPQPGLTQILPIKLDFAREWQQFTDSHAALVVQLTDQHFPYLFVGRASPQSAALVWEEGGAGVLLADADPAEGARGAFQLVYDADSTAATAKDPHLVVTYLVDVGE